MPTRSLPPPEPLIGLVVAVYGLDDKPLELGSKGSEHFSLPQRLYQAPSLRTKFAGQL